MACGMGRCSASHALSICSMAQPASPNSSSPTMRELPLSVWNARRSVVCSLRLPGSSAKTLRACKPLSTTSRASSRKMDRSSSSPSRSTVFSSAAGSIAAAGTPAGAATAAARSRATSASSVACLPDCMPANT
ncbi:hypothetical protein SDC9_183751 [bioreactor metagenome]|uniref:Uncharacterized protein n=1 Tax=bioreactor metagenome TaxID=1076179 RepID=A0A645HCZ5_9ZZZZ